MSVSLETRQALVAGLLEDRNWLLARAAEKNLMLRPEAIDKSLIQLGYRPS